MPIIPLEGKIIKILDSERVVINIGYFHGVKKEMKFFIYEFGEEICDPDTGTSLGNIEIVKHRVKVVHVQENFAIMRSNETFYPPIGIQFLGFRFKSNFLHVRPFFLDNGKVSEKNNWRIIRLGDKVKQDISKTD